MHIRNTTTISLADLSVRRGVDVLIEGNRITRLHSGLETGEEVIDGSNCVLLPGLVNLHSHTAMTLLRGVAEDVSIDDWFNQHIWMYEKNLTPHDVYVGTLLGAAEMLLSGVTAVADHYFYMDQAAEAYLKAGMRADLAWAVFGSGEGWRQRYKEALDFTCSYRSRDSRLTVTLGPHSPYLCPDDFLVDIARRAQEMGLKLHIHVSEEERQVARTITERGLTPVQVLDSAGVLGPGTILAHAYYATNEDLELIRRRGANVAHCPKTYLRFGDLHGFLPRAVAAGIRCGLGTDGPASNSTLGLFEVARDAALLAKCAMNDPTVARVDQILPLLSRGGEALGMRGYGRLEEGSLADLVLIRTDTPAMQPEHNLLANLLYALGDRSVDTVIVDGQIVVRHGRLVTVDLDELYREAAASAARLTGAVSGAPMQVY
jgi:5-methylthioadenosine/S-adenosylhomocysteine deaminase